MQDIVVGVDGSKNAKLALRWASDEAALHDARLTAVLAWSYLDQHHPDGSTDFDPNYNQAGADAAVHAVVEAAGVDRPVVEKAVLGLPPRALLEEGAEADLLVVGARGRGGFKGLLLGSVSERVLEHAPCPVAVIRETTLPPLDGAVVVGVDGSESARAALRWAAAEARAREAVLRVVHAWTIPYFAEVASAEILSTLEASARQVLEEALDDPALEGLTVEGHSPCMGAAQAVIGLADDASLIVAGTRGLGRFGRVLLGSTTRQLAQHSSVPLIVVPLPEEP